MRLSSSLLLVVKWLPFVFLVLFTCLDIWSEKSSLVSIALLFLALPIVSFVSLYYVFGSFVNLPPIGKSVFDFFHSPRVLSKYGWVVLIEETFLRWIPIKIITYYTHNSIIIPIVVSIVFILLHLFRPVVTSYDYIKQVEFVIFFLLSGIAFFYFPLFYTLFIPHWIRNSIIQIFTSHETRF